MEAVHDDSQCLVVVNAIYACVPSYCRVPFTGQVNIINFLYVDMINVFVTIGEFDIRTTAGIRYNKKASDLVFDPGDTGTGLRGRTPNNMKLLSPPCLPPYLSDYIVCVGDQNVDAARGMKRP